jgi:hypothetical protein
MEFGVRDRLVKRQVTKFRERAVVTPYALETSYTTTAPKTLEDGRSNGRIHKPPQETEIGVDQF